MAKYRNKKCQDADGNKFDSKLEMNRFIDLSLMEKAGLIANLERQKKYELIPKQKSPSGKVERAASYIADFVYTENGKVVVEDTKGFATKDYILKRKLMLHIHGIEVKEIFMKRK